MKKILMLGASYFQIPAIKYARGAGYHVITADYLPNNPGHKFSHEYYNVSTIDKEAILKLALNLKIDGILSYASDPGAPTAAYVAEKMELAGNPYESVKILQKKNLFRKFLKEKGFLVPKFRSFHDINEAKDFAAYLLKDNHIIIKPSDSSGSKGVTKLTSIQNFEKAFIKAQNNVINGPVIIEIYINKSIYEMDGDGFVWKGKLVFRHFGNQHNDIICNPYVPAGISFPYVQSDKVQNKAHKIIDSILAKLNMKVGGLNIEYLTDKNENIYILEIGPRNGGNLIPEVIKYSTGVDLIKYAVEGAMGKDCSDIKMKGSKGFYSSYIIHSLDNGILKEIIFSKEIEKNIVERNIWAKKGEFVKKFNGSNNTIGTLILQFSSKDEMLTKLDNMNKYIKVIVKED